METSVQYMSPYIRYLPIMGRCSADQKPEDSGNEIGRSQGQVTGCRASAGNGLNRSGIVNTHFQHFSFNSTVYLVSTISPFGLNTLNTLLKIKVLSFNILSYRCWSQGVGWNCLMTPCQCFRVRFFGRIHNRIWDLRSYGFFTTKKTEDPKKDHLP